MADSSSYCDFILSKLAGLDVTAKRMFGGFVLHMSGRVLGFVFDDTFLFEPVPTALALMPEAPRKELFPGSKLFIVIDESMDPHQLCELAIASHEELPVPRPRRARGHRRDVRKAPEKAPDQREIEREFPFAKFIKD